ncbi:MAG: hypothetical protein CML06_13820 [Pseudomonadales bacterium]|nr:hypothetical protein [Pseudomonadales bacterium]
MLKKILLLSLFVIVSGCATQQQLNIKPLMGVEFQAPKNIDTIELQDTEIMFFDGKQVIGGAQRIKATSENKPAIEELKENLSVAEGGSNKPSVIDLGDSKYCFTVSTDKFTTIYLAVVREPNYWTIISVQNQYYPEVLKSLKKMQ